MISLEFGINDGSIIMDVNPLQTEDRTNLEIGCDSKEIGINIKEEDSEIIIPTEMFVEEPHVCLHVDEYISDLESACPFDYYEGKYAVIPKAEHQTLETKEKIMRKDVEIEKIPVHEVSNESGTTIVIGGIL